MCLFQLRRPCSALLKAVLCTLLVVLTLCAVRIARSSQAAGQPRAVSARNCSCNGRNNSATGCRSAHSSASSAAKPV